MIASDWLIKGLLIDLRQDVLIDGRCNGFGHERRNHVANPCGFIIESARQLEVIRQGHDPFHLSNRELPVIVGMMNPADAQLLSSTCQRWTGRIPSCSE